MILVDEFGQHAWILQAMSAVQEAVQNCIENLSGTTAPATNSQPLGQGGQYAFAARTRQELEASAHEAAVAGQVSQARVGQMESLQKSEQALAGGDVDMFALLQKRAGLQDPMAQPEVKNDSGSDEWVF